jgi:predicted ester cyclase
MPFAAELFGGLALIAGVYTRVVALGLFPVLLGALTVHWPNGWYFAAPNGGWEYIGVLLAALIVQSCLGSGHFALVRHQNGDNMNSTQVSRERKGRESSRERAQATMVIVAGAAAAATLAFASTSQTTATMSAADGATIAHRYFEEVWNRGHVDVLDELLAPDYVNHTPSAGNPAPGPNGLKPIVLAIRRAFPDLHFTIEDVVVTQDAIAIRTTMTGTHEGELFGIAPTHRAVRVMQIQIERLRKGRIVDHWRVTDDLTLMRQLGVVR